MHEEDLFAYWRERDRRKRIYRRTLLCTALGLFLLIVIIYHIPVRIHRTVTLYSYYSGDSVEARLELSWHRRFFTYNQLRGRIYLDDAMYYSSSGPRNEGEIRRRVGSKASFSMRDFFDTAINGEQIRGSFILFGSEMTQFPFSHDSLEISFHDGNRYVTVWTNFYRESGNWDYLLGPADSHEEALEIYNSLFLPDNESEE